MSVMMKHCVGTGNVRKVWHKLEFLPEDEASPVCAWVFECVRVCACVCVCVCARASVSVCACLFMCVF